MMWGGGGAHIRRRGQTSLKDSCLLYRRPEAVNWDSKVMQIKEYKRISDGSMEWPGSPMGGKGKKRTHLPMVSKSDFWTLASQPPVVLLIPGPHSILLSLNL